MGRERPIEEITKVNRERGAGREEPLQKGKT